MVPGEIEPADGDIEVNEGLDTVSLRVTNTGDRPVQVGSHYHFFEVNRALDFDRTEAFGMRLDVPAGNSIRFEPGDEKDVDLVEIGGMKRIFGFDDVVDGAATAGSTVRQAMHRATERGYRGAQEWQASRDDPGERQEDSR